MASNTPRLGFYMPADDGSEPINVATDINDNLEKLDNSVGFVPSTSTTPPTTPFNGMTTYETDTNRVKFRTAGGVWRYLLTAGATFLSNILLDAANKIGIGTSSPAAYLDVLRPAGAAADPVIYVRYANQTNNRLTLTLNSLQMGDGNLVPDVGFVRTSYGQINIVGSVNMTNLSVNGPVAASSVNVTGNLDVDGSITSDLNVLGKLSGSGSNVPNIIRKVNDTARTSTTTSSDDPEITFFAQANSFYFVQVYIIYSATTAADFRCAWSFPTGTTGLRWVLGQAPAGTDRESTLMRTGIHQLSSDIIMGGHSVSLYTGAMDSAIITTGSTAGNITMKFAQGTSSVDAATLRAGTVMIYRKLD